MFRIRMLPAEDGDCFLIEIGRDDALFRILLDGERQSTAQLIIEIIDRFPHRPEPVIDLMVLTHIDADHIEGLLELIRDPKSLQVGEIWFNGLDHVKMAAGRKPLPTTQRAVPREKALRGSRAVLGIRQAAEFSRAIAARGWKWNESFGGAPVMVPEGKEQPSIPLPHQGRIVLLGPSQHKLADFADEWETTFHRLDTPSKAVLTGRPRPTPTLGNVDLMAARCNSADKAIPNGTSIAIVIEYGGRRALFSADAHPDDLAQALEQYAPGPTRVSFDAVKVAHHGSAQSNISQLIDRLEASRWLISSNGSRHQHPDPEAIARIVLTPKRDKKLIFNYRTKFNEVWSDPALAERYGYTPRFPNGLETIDIDIINNST